MVLDHTRDYFHISAYTFDPTDPGRSYLLLYLTRWATHLCAPTLVFLAGVSAYLQGANGKSKPELTRFLLTRGVWLIALELIGALIVAGHQLLTPIAPAYLGIRRRCCACSRSAGHRCSPTCYIYM